MTSRFATFAVYALVAVSLWAPGAGASAVWELLRYALFLGFSAAIILDTALRQGIVFSRSPEWIFLAAFLLYTSLSALWSEGGADALIKGGLIFSAMLVSISMANAVGLSGLLRIFYNAMSVFVLLSLLTVIFFPERGIETGWLRDGAWRGIAGQKNGLGAVSSLVFVASLSLPVVRHQVRRRQLLAYAARASVIVMSALCMVNSGSRGAIMIAAVGLALIVIARAPRPLQRIGLIVLTAAAIPLLYLAFATLEFHADKIGVLGTTIDSNSRVTLWLYGLSQLSGRELLGFGVGGFWTAERVIAFRDLHGWVLDNFHNGYVTILVEGGVLGVTLLLLALGFLVLLYFVAIGNIRDSYLVLAFAYAGIFIVNNLTENEIGRSTSTSFIMFLALSFAVRPHVWRQLTEPAPWTRSHGSGLVRTGASPA